MPLSYNRYPVGTVEYMSVQVTADVPLDDQPIVISIDGGATWLPATWLGASGLSRRARTVETITFDGLGTQAVRVKIDDASEIPIMDCGSYEVHL